MKMWEMKGKIWNLILLKSKEDEEDDNTKGEQEAKKVLSDCVSLSLS